MAYWRGRHAHRLGSYLALDIEDSPWAITW